MERKITVRTQILTGNLGDGWNDNRAVADAYAEFIRKQWLEDLAPYTETHEVEVSIDIQQASGSSAPLRVDVDGYGRDFEASIDLERTIEEEVLTPDSILWDRFCVEVQNSDL